MENNVDNVRAQMRKGVLEYSTETVRVNTQGMIVSVSGRELNLRCISDSALIIDGFITAVTFTV